ncbi:hypothetical protein GCM10007884_45430 [Methylobacterium brachythecii]|nr:hypothetical protein GCM10007884_45430 [Methylobacterium brachythecii]
MNEIEGSDANDAILHLIHARSGSKKQKLAFFGYAWNGEWRLDAYMREVVSSISSLGIDVDVYIGNQFTREGGPKGFREDLTTKDLKAFVKSQDYDFAFSFNNALITPDTVDGLDCVIVSIVVDSRHHLFDHMDDGGAEVFRLPIHVAPIYTSLVSDLEFSLGHRTLATFLPAATQITRREPSAGEDSITISWIASLVGDHNVDSFMARIPDLPGGLELVKRCLSDIERTGKIGDDCITQEAAHILCSWASWDFQYLEMQLQNIVTNGTRLATVDILAPLGLRVFGNKRWRTASTFLPAVAYSYRSGSGLQRHAELCAIYDQSKISINFPQSQAATGMQYRILDILASKSLLITKDVPDSDMEKLFGKTSPIVTFTDLADLRTKCNYYLNNEEERLDCVKKCNALVATGFSFRERTLQYLDLSNKKASQAINPDDGRGSIILIGANRVREWAARHWRTA